MRKMIREVLGSNPGPDRKNVGIGFRPTGIPWGVNSRSQRIPIRLGSRLWNDPQTNKQTNKPTLLFLPRLFDGKDPSANAAGNSLINFLNDSKCQLLLPKVPAALFIIKGQDEFRFELSLSIKSQCKISFLADSMEGLSHFSIYSSLAWSLYEACLLYTSPSPRDA